MPKLARVAVLILLLAGAALRLPPAWSQAGHLGHHPKEPADAPAPARVAPAGTPMTSMMAGMRDGEGEGEHGGGGRAPLYPSLANLETLTPAQRRDLASEADQRIHSGLSLIASASREAAHASTPLSMTRAAERLRDGLDIYETGLAARTALTDEESGRRVALDWYRRQLDIAPDEPAQTSVLGLTPMHLLLMTILVLVAGGLLALQFLRLRRVRALLAQNTLPLAATARSPTLSPAAAPADKTARPEASGGSSGTVIADAGPQPRRRPWSGSLKVSLIVGETPTVETFRLVPVAGDRLPFDFLPGQFLQVEVEPEPGKPVRRSYTIASSPTQRGFVEITVKREEHGIVSCYLHDHVKVGDEVRVTGPFGSFTFTGSEADTIVLIAGGVGITPMMSVLRYLTDTAWPGEIFFLYGARSTAEFVFRDEIERLERRHPKLHVLATMQRSPGTVWLGPEGVLTKELVQGAVPDIAGRHIHLCGPPPMMAGVKGFLEELGVPAGRIHTEAFGPASLPGDHAPEAVTTAAPADSALSPATSPPRPAQPGVAPTTISFALSGVSAPLKAEETVLEAAEAAGVEIPFSCRVGECGVCVTKLLQGEVSMAVETGLDPADKAQNYVLACQARSTGGPLVVEA